MLRPISSLPSQIISESKVLSAEIRNRGPRLQTHDIHSAGFHPSLSTILQGTSHPTKREHLSGSPEQARRYTFGRSKPCSNLPNPLGTGFRILQEVMSVPASPMRLTKNRSETSCASRQASWCLPCLLPCDPCKPPQPHRAPQPRSRKLSLIEIENRMTRFAGMSIGPSLASPAVMVTLLHIFAPWTPPLFQLDPVCPVSSYDRGQIYPILRWQVGQLKGDRWGDDEH